MIFGMFILGHLLHVGLQIDAIARSETNQIGSRWFIVTQNGFRLAARFFVSTMLFLFGWNHPESVPSLLEYMGVTVNESWQGILTFPINAPMAGMVGFCIDTLLAYVPFLKNQLPPIEFTKTETTVRETKTVKKTTTTQVEPVSGDVQPEKEKP